MHTGKTILITGANGFVGSRLSRYLHEHTGWTVRGIGRRPGPCVDTVADITRDRDLEEIGSRFADVDAVIHTAAVSRPYDCDADPDTCRKVNVQATGDLATQFPDAAFLFFSTYAVYNRKEGNSTEETPVAPANLYIATKLGGEGQVARSPNHVILRPSVIFGYSTTAHDNYFMTLLRAVREGREMVSPADQFFNPMHVEVVSRLVRDVIALGLSGVFNIGCNEQMSKYEFNRAVLDRFGLRSVPVKCGSTDGIPRPMNATISSEKIQQAVGYRIPPFPEMLDMLFAECQGLEWGAEARSAAGGSVGEKKR